MTPTNDSTERAATPRRPSVSCVFVCYDGAGRMLLARRSAQARDEAGTWDCGAGEIEFGESFEEAVAREVREEYSTDIQDLAIIGVRNILRDNPPSHWVAVIFAAKVDPGGVCIGEPHKFDGLDWFDPDALPAPLHSQLAPTVDMFKEWRATGRTSSR